MIKVAIRPVFNVIFAFGLPVALATLTYGSAVMIATLLGLTSPGLTSVIKAMHAAWLVTLSAPAVLFFTCSSPRFKIRRFEKRENVGQVTKQIYKSLLAAEEFQSRAKAYLMLCYKKNWTLPVRVGLALYAFFIYAVAVRMMHSYMTSESAAEQISPSILVITLAACILAVYELSKRVNQQPNKEET
jgi:hypothetical protein